MSPGLPAGVGRAAAVAGASGPVPSVMPVLPSVMPVLPSLMPVVPSLMVGRQVRPPARPITVRGTTRTEPSDAGSQGKLPNATGPQPARPTRSSTAAVSNSAPTPFSPAVNLSSPARNVVQATSPP